MNIRFTKKIIATVLSFAVLFMMVYLVAFEAQNLTHKCTGDGCLICHELHIAENITKQTTPAVMPLMVGLMAAFFIKKMGSTVSDLFQLRSLIVDKIRMDS